MVIISLIGKQPVPNLLPLRYQLPDTAVLVCTDQTEKVARQLEQLLARNHIGVQLLFTDAYDIRKIQEDLQGFLREKGWQGADLIFNLTGGTKTMVLAAYEVAREYQAPFLYLESEEKKSHLYKYRFENGVARREGDEILPGCITIDDYLRAYVGNYSVTGPAKGTGGIFEQVIVDALQSKVDEILPGVTLGGALEVDLVVRCENQVGVISAKTGKKAREKVGLDQLNAACDPEYLGTYTRKMLVINQAWPARYNLRDLARAWDIRVIELPSFSENSPSLSLDDQQHLVQTVRQVLLG